MPDASQEMKARLLNFGCGDAYHPGWINLDATPASPQVIAHDVRRGLPFAADGFDAVYGSHVLEHLEPLAGGRLLQECFRVLKPGGIARIVVPDLEAIARLYLQYLEGAMAGDPEAQKRYDWMMLELLDQTTRASTGGRMAAFLRGATDERLAHFVADRIGDEAGGTTPKRAQDVSLFRWARRLGSAATALRRTLAGGCAYVLLGSRGAAALREGLFRQGGEVHRWMYDRHSLVHALSGAGFVEARPRSADDSDIPGFPRYGLETAAGRARKPDSLYVEARKPRRA